MIKETDYDSDVPEEEDSHVSKSLDSISTNTIIDRENEVDSEVENVEDPKEFVISQFIEILTISNDFQNDAFSIKRLSELQEESLNTSITQVAWNFKNNPKNKTLETIRTENDREKYSKPSTRYNQGYTDLELDFNFQNKKYLIVIEFKHFHIFPKPINKLNYNIEISCLESISKLNVKNNKYNFFNFKKKEEVLKTIKNLEWNDIKKFNIYLNPKISSKTLEILMEEAKIQVNDYKTKEDEKTSIRINFVVIRVGYNFYYCYWDHSSTIPNNIEIKKI